MTLKEKVAKVKPSLVGCERYVGGVRNCPNDYEFLKGQQQLCRNQCSSSEVRCAQCWNQEFKESEKVMTKSDLRTGYIVTTRKGSEYVVFKGAFASFDNSENIDMLVNGITKNWSTFGNYNDNLTREDGYRDSDIVKVEQASHPYSFMDLEYGKKTRKLLWERKESLDVTMEEVNAKFERPVRIVERKVN